MQTINISNDIKNATGLAEVADIINDAATGHVEGVEGLEFTPAMLAGQYAQEAAKAAGFGESEENIEAHLDFLVEAGAIFDFCSALAHGVAIAAVRAEEKE